MNYLILKAFHIIFMVSWFAGVFFLGRVLVYIRESLEKSQEERSLLLPMLYSGARRVWYIIMLPSILITLVVGMMLMGHTGAYSQGWFHVKMVLVILFIIYNFYLNKLRLRMLKEDLPLSGLKLRLLNEVPFLFLISICFTVFLRDFFSGLWAAFVVIGGSMAIGFISFFLNRLKKKHIT
jgi:putative membrane protein